MPTSLVSIGSAANDGSGDPIRTAFSTVNDNFDLINSALFSGSESSIISAVSVTAGYLISNTYVFANTYVNANSIVGNTVTSYGNLYVSQDGAYIVGNVTIVGNLNVSGSQAASQSQQSSSPILALHYSATPLVTDDGKDIGTEWQYYKGAEKLAFLGWQNSTRSLVYMDDITDSANVISGTFGNVKFGSLVLGNTTTATSNTSGALQVAGGVSTQGNLYVQGNLVATIANVANLSVTGYHVGSLNFAGSDTIYINGSAVQTAASAFSGGEVGGATFYSDTTPTTRLGTGTVKVAGGFSANGNVYVGGNIVIANTSSSIGYTGNILTAAQPYITSLGELTLLNMGGQINAQNIIPEVNLTYNLGSGNTTRWSKIWAYDIDASGTLNGSTGSFTDLDTISLTASGNVSITEVTPSTSTGTGALTVAGGLGVAGNIVAPYMYITNGIRWLANGTAFASGTFTEMVTVSNAMISTSTSTGALTVAGGVGIAGNLYISNTGDVSANIGKMATRARAFTSVMIFGG